MSNAMIRQPFLAVLLLAAAPGAWAATFPSDSRVFFQTSGCQRAAGIGDWYTTQSSASTARYSEFFVEVTEGMSPATITILDAESTDGGMGEPIDDEVANGSDPTRYELLDKDGNPIGYTVHDLPSGSTNGQSVGWTSVPTGLYRIRSYTGSDEIQGVACGTNPSAENDDDNGFRIEVNGVSAIDGLLGFLQTTYQQNTSGAINYQMYFLVGPDISDSTLELRNFDLDCNASGAVYNEPPNATGAARTGTISENAEWNGQTPCADYGNLDTGADNELADNDLGSGANDAGTWGYRIDGWTDTNQTIFEANDTGLRLALTDAIPTRAGFFSITPSGTLNTIIGSAVDHDFTVENLFFTKDVINFTLANTSANYTTQLFRYANSNCSGALTALTDNDSDGNLDTGLLDSAGQAGALACFTLRVTPDDDPAADTSDTTQINATSLMDSKVGASTTTRSIQKTTLLPPAISKDFSPNPMAEGGISTLTFTLTNINTVPVTLAAIAFTDPFPTTPDNMIVATPLTTTNNCGGTLLNNSGGTLAVDDPGIRYDGGSIPASSSCTVSVNVTAATEGNYVNTTTTNITSTNAGTGNAANATLTVQANVPPSITKSFNPDPIGVGGTSTLTLTITNSNSTVMNGIEVSDTYPANLINETPHGAATTCGGPLTVVDGGLGISLSGGSLGAGASCTVTVDVTSSTNANYLNTTGAVVSSNFGTGNTASDSLVVHAPPTVAKSFNPTPVATDTPSVLTITLTNPNSTGMTGAAITDTYPANVVNSSVPNASTTCGGAVSATAGADTVALTGGTLPASGSCTITVNVESDTVGSYDNVIDPGDLTTDGGINNTVGANATLDVQAIAAPTITKSFTPALVDLDGTSVLELVISNPNNFATLTGVDVTDTYPGEIDNQTPANALLSCTSGSNATVTGGGDGGGSVGLTAGTILPNGSCTITVNVTPNTTAGAPHTNITGDVTSTNGGNGGTATADLDVQDGRVPPVVWKDIAPSDIGVGSVATLTLTILNPNNETLNDVSVQDDYPAGLVNATPSNFSSTCPGGIQYLGGDGEAGVGLQDGGAGNNNMTANSTCEITVDVTSAAEGTYNNLTDPVRSTEGGALTGNQASASITFSRPTISKSFSPATMPSGGTSQLEMVLSNPSAVDLTGATFTDSFPTVPGNMTVAAPLTATNTCGGTLDENDPIDGDNTLEVGDGSIRLTGGTIPAGGSCLVRVNVTATAGGDHDNSIAAGGLSTSGGTNAASADATLTVPNRPTISKAFDAGTIPVLGVSTLTITLSNNNAGIAATNAAFTDGPLPAGLVTSGSPTTNCGGTASSTTNSVSLSGGTIPAGTPGTCTVTINVLNDADTDSDRNFGANSYANTIAADALSTSLGTNAAPFTDDLNVIGGYKSVSVQTDTDSSGGPSVGDTLLWSVFFHNPPGGTDIDSFQVTDAIGANMTVPGSGALSISYLPATCSGGIENNSYDGTGDNDLFDAPFTFNADCTVRVDIPVTVGAGAAGTTLSNQATGSGDGLVTTLTDNIDNTTTGQPGDVAPLGNSVDQIQLRTAISPTTVLIAQPPTISKVFSPGTVQSGAPATLTITLTNPNGGFQLTGATFLDTFPTSPGQMVVADTPNASTDCGAGTLEDGGGGSVSAGDIDIRLVNGTIPAGGTCTVTVDVQATTGGTYTNTIPQGGLVTSGGVNDAPTSDTLGVVGAPTVDKTSIVISDPFSEEIDPKRIPGAVIEYIITVTNTNTSAGISDIEVTDNIPVAVVSYVPGSITVAGVSEDDNDTGGDEADPYGADFGFTAADTMTAIIPTLSVGSSIEVRFRVTID